jgi:hypothetical protein
MTKPFKVTGGDGQQKSAEEQLAAPPGTGIVSALKSGQPLATPSQEVIEGRSHGHSPRIPWPPAGGPDDKKPFKI